MAQSVRNPYARQEILVKENHLKRELATCSIILAWKIPWTEEHARLESDGPQRVRHNWVAKYSSIQFSFSAVTPVSLCDPMDCDTPGYHDQYQLLELVQTHVHQVSDAIQPYDSVIPISFCLQSFSASRSFPMSQLFESDGQSIAISASASVLPMNVQD